MNGIDVEGRKIVIARYFGSCRHVEKWRLSMAHRCPSTWIRKMTLLSGGDVYREEPSQ